jgi:muramoyltetrapeptide carboxypeptidase
MPKPVKPSALSPGAAIRIVAPASPVQEDRLGRGCDELARLGFAPRWDPRVLARDGFFAGPAADRWAVFSAAMYEPISSAILFARGGYGSNYLLEHLDPRRLKVPKIIFGYSDVTSLQAYLWEKLRWITFYGPMAAAGLDNGPDAPGGYEPDSFARAILETRKGWPIELEGETIYPGRGEGRILGGCMTIVQATLGTPWELQTRGSILLLEDRGMKPYQVDRVLMHLKQAGKFKGLKGLIFGDFPDCDGPPDSPTVRQIVERLIEPLGIPTIWGAPVGHTHRAMLTVPLGVRGLLVAHGSGRLEILEPACRAAAPTNKVRGGGPSKND